MKFGIYRRQKRGSRFLGYRSKKMNAVVVAAERREAPGTVGDPAVVRIVAPTTTSEDADGRIVSIEAPLVDVATHIIQPIAIRFLLANRMRLASTVAVIPAYFI